MRYFYLFVVFLLSFAPQTAQAHPAEECKQEEVNPRRSCNFLRDDKNELCPILEIVLPECDLKIEGMLGPSGGSRRTVTIGTFRVGNTTCAIPDDALSRVQVELGYNHDHVDPSVLALLASEECRSTCETQSTTK